MFTTTTTNQPDRPDPQGLVGSTARIWIWICLYVDFNYHNFVKKKRVKKLHTKKMIRTHDFFHLWIISFAAKQRRKWIYLNYRKSYIVVEYFRPTRVLSFLLLHINLKSTTKCGDGIAEEGPACGTHRDLWDQPNRPDLEERVVQQIPYTGDTEYIEGVQFFFFFFPFSSFSWEGWGDSVNNSSHYH